MSTFIRYELNIEQEYRDLGIESVDWQTSDDIEFNNIIYNNINDTSNLTKLDYTLNISNVDGIYMRSRFKTKKGYTEWSEISSCSIATIKPPRMIFNTEDLLNIILPLNINLSNFDNSLGGGVYNNTDWIIRSRNNPLNKIEYLNNTIFQDSLVIDSNTFNTSSLQPGELLDLFVRYNGINKNGIFSHKIIRIL